MGRTSPLFLAKVVSRLMHVESKVRIRTLTLGSPSRRAFVHAPFSVFPERFSGSREPHDQGTLDHPLITLPLIGMGIKSIACSEGEGASSPNLVFEET